MITFDGLKDAGAAAAFMTGAEDGDCSWDGCDSGSRPASLARSPIPQDKLVVLRQCHGDRIVQVARNDAGRGAMGPADALDEADGLITDQRGVPLGVTVADCVPIYLVAPGACALVHAGRAGTAQRIAAKAVAAMEAAFDVDAASITALIGPSAGPCCYEVSPEMRADWVGKGLVSEGNSLDLWRSNRQQLREAGVPDARIEVAEWCTICRPGFFSYRGQGTTMRNLAVLML